MTEIKAHKVSHVHLYFSTIERPRRLKYYSMVLYTDCAVNLLRDSRTAPLEPDLAVRVAVSVGINDLRPPGIMP